MQNKQTSNKKLYIICTLFIVFIYLVIAYLSKGFQTDINTYQAWGALASQKGFRALYASDVFLDYPPGYIYILCLLEKIRSFLGWGFYGKPAIFLIKLPAIISSFILSYTLYKFSEKHNNIKQGVIISLLLLILPFTITNAAIWGQSDALMSVLLLLSLIKLYDDKPLFSCFIFGIAILMKPQSLMFAPLFLVYFLIHYDILTTLKSCFIGLMTIIIGAFPAIPNPINLFKLYFQTFSSYSYATINTPNFYGLFMKNWQEVTSFMQISMYILLIFISIIFALTIKKSNRKSTLFFSAFLMIFSFYMILPKMHERYLFPAIVFLAVSAIIEKEKILTYLFVCIGVLHGTMLLFALKMNMSIYNDNKFFIFLSFLHVLIYIFSLYIGFKLYYTNRTITIKQIKKSNQSLSFSYCNTDIVKISKKELCILSLIIISYSFLAFWDLGSHYMPKTYWLAQTGDSATIQIEEKNVSSLYSIFGLAKQGKVSFANADFKVEYSKDLQSFNEIAEIKNTSIYAWNNTFTSINSGYLKFTALADNVLLNEIALCLNDEESFAKIIPLDDNAILISDEQEHIPYCPTYYDSSYFDEIYFARTAQEQILGTIIYENTHPPLGKSIISLGITIFGMNPFGFRFMGVVFGILILPAIFFLSKKIFKNYKICLLITTIFAFDFMHYTQSRIATIDTFCVFFIILMYYFLLCYLQDRQTNIAFSKQLIHLLLSGVFMGLAMSIKWNSAYGIIGMAVLFFYDLIYRYILCCKNKILSEKYIKNSIKLCSMCVIFFILVPICIYILSYFQVVDNSFSDIINYQKHMFNYHTTLKDTHPFESKWYQWLFDIKPLWYSYCSEANGIVHSISAFGNPLIWLLSIPTILFTAYYGFKQNDFTGKFIVIGFISCLLPWVFISRSSYIYHFYPCIIFVILAIGYVWNYISNKGRFLSAIPYIHTFAILVLFFIFFPVLSGKGTTNDYLTFLQWMPLWIFN